MSKRNLTPNQLLKLNHLNNYLIQMQNEILEKQKFYSAFCSKLLAEEKFTNDYEIELEVNYYVDESLVPSKYSDGHLWQSRNHSLKPEELEIWFDKSPREGDDLPLEQPCCYLLHCLLYHSWLDLKWILKIKTVWIDIHLRDQSIMDIDLKTGKLTSGSSIIIFDVL
jgi:hypothetical protein